MVAMCMPPFALGVPSPDTRAKRVTPCREMNAADESRAALGFILGNLPKIPPRGREARGK